MVVETTLALILGMISLISLVSLSVALLSTKISNGLCFPRKEHNITSKNKEEDSMTILEQNNQLSRDLHEISEEFFNEKFEQTHEYSFNRNQNEIISSQYSTFYSSSLRNFV